MNSEPTIPSGFGTSPFSMRWSKKARFSSRSFSNAAKVYFNNASAEAVQNSARCLVFEASARKVGAKV